MNEPVSKVRLKCCPHCNYTKEKFDKNKRGFKDFDEPDKVPTWKNHKPYVFFSQIIGAWGSWVIECPICKIMIVYGNDTDEGAILTWNELLRNEENGRERNGARA